MTATAQHKSTVRINEDTVDVSGGRVPQTTPRQWMVDGVIEPALHEAAVSFGLWFDQAQFRERYSSLRLDRFGGSRSDDGLERGIQARR